MKMERRLVLNCTLMLHLTSLSLKPETFTMEQEDRKQTSKQANKWINIAINDDVLERKKKGRNRGRMKMSKRYWNKKVGLLNKRWKSQREECLQIALREVKQPHRYARARMRWCVWHVLGIQRRSVVEVTAAQQKQLEGDLPVEAAAAACQDFSIWYIKLLNPIHASM